MFVSCKHSKGQNHSIKTGNKTFESVTKFRYLGTTLMSQNFIREVIKRRLELRDSLLHFSPEFFAYSLLPKSMKIKIIQNYNFFLFYVCVVLGL